MRKTISVGLLFLLVTACSIDQQQLAKAEKECKGHNGIFEITNIGMNTADVRCRDGHRKTGIVGN